LLEMAKIIDFGDRGRDPGFHIERDASQGFKVGQGVETVAAIKQIAAGAAIDIIIAPASDDQVPPAVSEEILGARATKPVAKNFTVGVQLVNGWNNVEDNNSGKTFGFTTAWTGGKVSWYNNYYVGPEKTKTNEGYRHFYDTVLNITPNAKTSIYANFDYGHESQVFGSSAAEWIAIGVAGRVQTSTHTAFALRYENYNDRQGFITGVPQKLNSFTATGEYKWMQGLLARLEYPCGRGAHVSERRREGVPVRPSAEGG